MRTTASDELEVVGIADEYQFISDLGVFGPQVPCHAGQSVLVARPAEMPIVVVDEFKSPMRNAVVVAEAKGGARVLGMRGKSREERKDFRRFRHQNACLMTAGLAEVICTEYLGYGSRLCHSSMSSREIGDT